MTAKKLVCCCAMADDPFPRDNLSIKLFGCGISSIRTVGDMRSGYAGCRILCRSGAVDVVTGARFDWKAQGAGTIPRRITLGAIRAKLCPLTAA